jgi:hypothetical protein
MKASLTLLTLAATLWGFSRAGCGSTVAPPTVADARAADGGGPTAQILDVFFGLDNALPSMANFLCMGAGGMDGMPVTFSRRIGVDNPSASAFRVTTRSGATHTPRCATLRSAVGPSERHTVLLIGEFGQDPGDPPVRLDVIGSVPLLGGATRWACRVIRSRPCRSAPRCASRIATRRLRSPARPAHRRRDRSCRSPGLAV